MTELLARDAQAGSAEAPCRRQRRDVTQVIADHDRDAAGELGEGKDGL